MTIKHLYTYLIFISLFTSMLHANKVNITEELPYVDIMIKGKKVRIQRIQDTQHKLKNDYAKTSRPTPPFDIQPFTPIKGVKTISELDVLDFLKDDLSSKNGIFIDARLPVWFEDATIPGSVNIPFTLFIPKNMAALLPLFGVTKTQSSWDFTHAKKLALFCNGPWCHQSVTAIKHLIKEGYPKSKLFYYRGGMQYWQLLGLTTQKGIQ